MFLSTPVRKEDQLISTWVLIRNDSRITGKPEVIGSSTRLVPTNTLLCTLLLDRRQAGSDRTGLSLCTRRPGEFEDCPKGCSSQGSGDSDNLSDNLCILMVSQPLRSLVAR